MHWNQLNSCYLSGQVQRSILLVSTPKRIYYHISIDLLPSPIRFTVCRHCNNNKCNARPPLFRLLCYLQYRVQSVLAGQITIQLNEAIMRWTCEL